MRGERMDIQSSNESGSERERERDKNNIKWKIIINYLKLNPSFYHFLKQLKYNS